MLGATGFASVLAIVYLLLPRMGSDLSAQYARAGFAEAYGLAPVDFSWYGGTQQFGYSLVSQFAMALVPPRLVGALAAVAGTAALATVFARSGVRRPLLGGLLVAAGQFGNLASGRITYALGVAFGLLALLALTTAARASAGEARRHTGPLALAATAALLASATSPVAGLFTGLAGVALLLTGRRREGLAIGIAAAAPILIMALLFGNGGYMNFPRPDLLRALGATIAVIALAPAALRTVRVGALIYAGGLIAAYLVHTPVGSNATRLAGMFALAVIGATAPLRWPAMAAALAAVALVQPPVVFGDVARAGAPASRPAYFQPLLDELDRRRPIGRVEVPPLHEYWESAYVASEVPLARGWLRQVDIERNRLFYDGSLDAETYHAWLVDNGVEYVALPGAELSWTGDEEGLLVESGLPYLTEVWRNDDWRLYRVDDAPSILDGPVRLVATAPGGVTVRADTAGIVLVRVRYSRWLSLAGPAGCLAPEGRWTRLEVREPGTYRIGSRLAANGDRC